MLGLKLFKPELIKYNLFATLIYLSGAIISCFLNLPNLYFLPLWIPLGLMVGYAFFKGRTVIFGFALSSILVHIILTNRNLNTDGFSWIDGLVIALAEVFLLAVFVWLKDKSKWNEVLVRKGNEVNTFMLFSLVIPVPIVLANLFVVSKYADYPLLEIALHSYVSTVLSLVLLATAFLSFYRKPTEKVFRSKKHFFEFVFVILLLIFIGLEHLHLNNFQSVSSSLLYIIFIPSVIYLSIRYSYRVFSLTLSLISILILFSTWKYADFDVNAAEILPLLIQNSVFLLITTMISIYIKENYTAKTNVIETLKSDYQNIDDEINRQIGEYKRLNDQLFIEIERRGIAERELENNRKLLSEAQAIGKISTWEFNFENNSFRWISKVQTPLFSLYEDEVANLKKISKLLHPDDLKIVKKNIDRITSGDQDIDLELRLRKQDGNFGDFLVKGRGYSELGKLKRVLGLIMDISEQKAAELKITEKEMKYKALFDSNIDSVGVIDADTLEIIEVNPAFEQIYGYSRSELVGKPYTIVSAQTEETKTVITFALQKGFYRVGNRVHRKKSGEEFYVEGSLVVQVVEGKKILYVISQDVTRRKAAENSLAEREQKFRTFFESDLVGMAELSITKEWISVNDKLCQILGYNQKELKLLTWDQITHPDDLEIENRLYNQLLTHEIDTYTLEKRFLSKNSKVIVCKVIVRSVQSILGNITHMIKLVEDITERKRAEQELIESRAKLSQAQSVAQLGIVRFLVGSDYLIVSDEAYQILGYGTKRPQLTRRDFFKTILSGPQTRFQEHICNLENDVLVEGSYEQAFVTSKGELRYTLANFGITKDDKGKVVEVVATLADITRIKQAEMALQEANILKDQIFSIIGHDLRSPIGSIHQLIELYSNTRKELDEESANSILDTLKQTSDETYKLLESLLDWAKEQRTVTFKPVKTDLVGLVNQVISLNRNIAESKGISIQSSITGKLFSLVDGEMIKTVLRNLVGNSIKFTPQGGMINLGISDESNFYRISVADTGKGIPEKILPTLFDNSSSYSTPGTENEKGTGLGLKLVKNFVEKNGGSISVESIPGQGTVFSFTLPKHIDHN